MRNKLLMVASALLVAACSGGIGSYEDGIEAQAEVMQEMLGVLEKVDDESSAKKAAGDIEALGNRLAEISGQMRELPRPDASEMRDIMQKHSAAMQEFQQDVGAQMMKLAEYPVLTDAWMRAMGNMR
ncbi:MAG: hypothetical protein KJO01_08725 [Gammaproteobacteria bacterium]|nr:hypothetical protein [Gammaproteobacteria bacterium]MBT8109346.1 hypothetical protein [Gammaproteobacteria bacterium]NNL44048.1 hypothetical protein [Woeseiaceae bacterium]